MHSTQGPSGLCYAHNGDFSGDVKVTIPMRRPGETYSWGTSSDIEVEINERDKTVTVDIPFEDIRALYLAYLRRNMISRVEQASDTELEAHLLGTATAADDLRELRDEQREKLDRLFSEERPAKLREGGIYQQKGGKILARIDRLTTGNHVRFSLWYGAVLEGSGEWTSGNMTTRQDFQEQYSTYCGTDTVTDAPEDTE